MDLSTNSLFFDTDALSAFLWINNQSILTKIFPGQIVIPKEVYDELKNPCVPQLKERIDTLIISNEVKIGYIYVGTSEYSLYKELVTPSKDKTRKVIGRGEASAIVLTKYSKGTLVSNNLSDVLLYVKKFELKHLTVGDILKIALDKNIITEEEGNNLWQMMLKKRRLLGYRTFSDFLKKGK